MIELVYRVTYDKEEIMISEKRIKKFVAEAIKDEKEIRIRTLDYQEVPIYKFLEEPHYLYKENIQDSYRSIILQMWSKCKNSEEEYQKVKQELTEIRLSSNTLEEFKQRAKEYIEGLSF